MADETRMAFTKKALLALQPPPSGRRYVYDTKAPGLALCVTSTGVRTFYRAGRVKGRYLRKRLGTFPQPLTVEKARTLAAKVGFQIAEGRDPVAEERLERGEWTLGMLFDWYLERHSRPRKKSWREDEAQFRRYLENWRGRRLSAIKRADVAQLHNRIGTQNGRCAANRCLALLSTMFNKAIGADLAETNPAKGVDKFRERSRERFLHPDELPRFFEALRAETDEIFSDYFMLALLVGARKSNMLAMQWGELHLDRALWNVPDSKSGEPLVLTLAAPAVLVLRRREAERNGSPFVFPGRGRTGHLADPKAAWNRIRERAGLQDVRMHDLRRSLGSYMAGGGASLPIVGRALGHKSQQATAVYARLELDPVRRAVDAAAATMLGIGERTGAAAE
jgi:integrase